MANSDGDGDWEVVDTSYTATVHITLITCQTCHLTLVTDCYQKSLLDDSMRQLEKDSLTQIKQQCSQSVNFSQPVNHEIDSIDLDPWTQLQSTCSKNLYWDHDLQENPAQKIEREKAMSSSCPQGGISLLMAQNSQNHVCVTASNLTGTEPV